jgi:hypothetical protein
MKLSFEGVKGHGVYYCTKKSKVYYGRSTFKPWLGYRVSSLVRGSQSFNRRHLRTMKNFTTTITWDANVVLFDSEVLF